VRKDLTQAEGRCISYDLVGGPFRVDIDHRDGLRAALRILEAARAWVDDCGDHGPGSLSGRVALADVYRAIRGQS
jgi:hypothetical protein